MKTCKTCKHWRRYLAPSYYGPYAGECSSDRFVYIGEESKTPKDSLLYWDHEGYAAAFNTGKDFGCVHWAAK